MGTQRFGDWLGTSVGFMAVLLAFYFAAKGCSDHRSGAGRGIPRAVQTGTQVDAAAGGSPSSPGTSLSSTAGASSSPSGQVEREPPSGPLDSPEGVPPGIDYEALARMEGFDWTPLEAVLSTTLDPWEDPEFRKFVGDQVASYPTTEDARLALESKGVQDALWNYLVASGVSSEFNLSPSAPKELRDNAQRAFETAQMDLYRALDRGSSFHDWETLGKLWRSYDQ